MGNAEYMGITTTVMKNTSRTQSAKAGKRKPWFRGKSSAAAPKEIVKAEATKAPRFYPTEDKKIKLTNNKANNKATKLKAPLVPGAVVILLAGRFKGQRAVFPKQLPSGLCLITGPPRRSLSMTPPRLSKRRLTAQSSRPSRPSPCSRTTCVLASPSRTASTHTRCHSKQCRFEIRDVLMFNK